MFEPYLRFGHCFFKVIDKPMFLLTMGYKNSLCGKVAMQLPRHTGAWKPENRWFSELASDKTESMLQMVLQTPINQSEKFLDYYKKEEKKTVHLSIDSVWNFGTETLILDNCSCC